MVLRDLWYSISVSHEVFESCPVSPLFLPFCVYLFPAVCNRLYEEANTAAVRGGSHTAEAITAFRSAARSQSGDEMYLLRPLDAPTANRELPRAVDDAAQAGEVAVPRRAPAELPRQASSCSTAFLNR